MSRGSAQLSAPLGPADVALLAEDRGRSWAYVQTMQWNTDRMASHWTLSESIGNLRLDLLDAFAGRCRKGKA